MRTECVSTADDVTYCRPSLSLNEGIMSQETEEEGNVGLEQNSVTWPRMRYEATNLDTANSEFNKSESERISNLCFALLQSFVGIDHDNVFVLFSDDIKVGIRGLEGGAAERLLLDNGGSTYTACKAMLAGAGQKQQSYMAVHQL